MYYYPALLDEDEQALRKQYLAQDAAHDKLNQMAGAGMFLSFWPLFYNLSKTVRPAGCAVFAAVWFGAYFKVVKPFTLSQFQSTLNNTAKPYAEKYGVKMDADYLKWLHKCKFVDHVETIPYLK